MVEIICCNRCRLVISENDLYGYTTRKGEHYCQNCYDIEFSDSSSSYSSSDEDYDKCYYCETELTYEMELYEDTEPAKPRYYCMSCLEHIHCDDINSP